ncbi:MAG: hypothetical protein M3471_01615 [Actinomycetota bacterium]|nr:hypothetical protein [Actinomycetota bacterium]
MGRGADPLFGDGPVAPDYLPGPLASAAGSLVVAEREDGPSVPELAVTNAGRPAGAAGRG